MKSRSLSGARKEVYDDLMSLMRVQNPEGSFRGRPGARIRRGEALTPGVVTGIGPKVTKTEGEKRAEAERKKKIDAALKKIEKMEEEEVRRERLATALETRKKRRKGYREAQKEKKLQELLGVSKTEPQRRALLREAAQREIEAKEAWRKSQHLGPLSAHKREQLIEDVASGVAAKWNLLAELNRRISEGEADYVPLRNTVAAELEGRLSGAQLDYTVKEALAELTAAEIRGIKQFFAEMKEREKPGKIRGWPVRGEGFVGRKVFEPTDPRAEILVQLSAPQVAVVKDEIRKWHTKRSQISKEDRRIIAKDPQVQRAFLKQLKRKGVAITRDELERIAYEDPKEVAMIVAAVVSKDPDVVKAIKKMEVYDRIKAYVADTPEVVAARHKLRAAEKREAEDLEILRTSIARERMGGSTLGSKKPIVLAEEAAARKEAKEYAETVDPEVSAKWREIHRDEDKGLWTQTELVLAKEATTLEGDEGRRINRIYKVIKNYEKVLERYQGVKKLKIYPYISPRLLKKKMGVKILPEFVKQLEQRERDRLVLFYDVDAKASLKKFRAGVRSAIKNLRVQLKGVKAKLSKVRAGSVEFDQLSKYQQQLIRQLKSREADAKIKTVAQYREHLLHQFREQVKVNTGNYPRIKSVKEYQEYFARRLYDTMKNRWRSLLMIQFERSGGRYLTAAERRGRAGKKGKKKELGLAYSMGGGLYGIIVKNIEVRQFGPGKFKGRAEVDGKVVTREGASRKGVEGALEPYRRYKWKVFGEDGAVLMWGVETTHALASRQIVKAHRVTYEIFKVAGSGEPGFDYLSDKDRKWLIANKPNLSDTLKKILMASLGEMAGREVDAETITWIATKEAMEEPMPIKAEGYVTSKDCKRMKPGEKRMILGKGFKIFVERSKSKTKARYDTVILTKSGRKSGMYRFPDCKTVLARAYSIAGAMEAGDKVVAAVGNPAALTRLENSAKRYFQKKNPRKKNPLGGAPSLPRRPAEVGTIEDLSGMIGLPTESDEAYRLGYYAGIIKGIDTCGVQNYLRRRKLRKEFQQRLLDAVVAHQESLTEPVGRGRRAATKPTPDWM